MTGLAFFGYGAAFGFTCYVVADAQAETFPWQLIANGSATAAVLVVGFFLLRRESQERASERAAFTASLREVTQTLATRMDAIAAQLKEDHDRAEVSMRELLTETRAQRRPNGAP